MVARRIGVRVTNTNGVIEGVASSPAFEGRDDSCEIHIDGDFLFMAFGLLGTKIQK